MAESIILDLKVVSVKTHLHVARQLHVVDAGPDAELTVRRASGRSWVVYKGRTDPHACGDLVKTLRAEIRAVLGIESGEGGNG